MQCIGILTSGGDAPGMNAAIRASVRVAHSLDIETVGYQNGFDGLFSNRFERLNGRSVGNLVHRGGTFLGTARSMEFMEPQGRARAAANMRAEGVDGLIVVGGDGSFRGALALMEEHGVAVAGVPGTIDNDVWGTDHTIGFDTAVNTALLAIDQLRDTSESTGMMFFVEVMGRTSGAIAIHTALAGGAAGVLIPEEHEPIPDLVKQLQHSLSRGKRSHIIVVAEGDNAGGAFGVAKEVSALFDHPYRVVVLGHVQRGGRPSATDRVVASLSGGLAATALAEGRTGIMIGMRNGAPVEIPLKDVVANRHPEPRFDILRLARTISS